MPTPDDVAELVAELPEVTEGERHGTRTWFVVPGFDSTGPRRPEGPIGAAAQAMALVVPAAGVARFVGAPDPSTIGQ